MMKLLKRFTYENLLDTEKRDAKGFPIFQGVFGSN